MARIAVLLATYNGERYVSELIESILVQSYDDYHLYIHDDGSKDNTCDILKKYEDEHSDKITVLDYPATGGAKNNFISLLREVKADYYMFCDQDDIWLKDKIVDTYNVLIENEKEYSTDACLVYSDLRIVDDSLNEIYPSYMSFMKRNPYRNSLEDLIRQNVVAGCTTIFNKELASIAIQNLNENKICMHDWWLALVASGVGRIVYYNKATILYRQHENNQVGANRSIALWFRRVIRNLKEHRQLKESREGILLHREMLIQLCEIIKGYDVHSTFANDITSLSGLAKIGRIKVYLKYRLIRMNLKNMWKYLLV